MPSLRPKIITHERRTQRKANGKGRQTRANQRMRTRLQRMMAVMTVLPTKNSRQIADA
ncbi:hypothetical protein F2Q69_00059476 [Brassica cretica]|uniref:Uncharacterized protein n=1 Tax=Brassica cretica TaxID=69181 RepID=A0A8S9RE21_BRACR|nr:hypothetical protein F2Q69_00059476 [Brassica cretica]